MPLNVRRALLAIEVDDLDSKLEEESRELDRLTRAQ
jgi:hypothetical protein